MAKKIVVKKKRKPGKRQQRILDKYTDIVKGLEAREELRTFRKSLMDKGRKTPQLRSFDGLQKRLRNIRKAARSSKTNAELVIDRFTDDGFDTSFWDAIDVTPDAREWTGVDIEKIAARQFDPRTRSIYINTDFDDDVREVFGWNS